MNSILKGTSETLRLCPSCQGRIPLRDGERVWPAGWTCEQCGTRLAEVDGVVLLAPELAGTISGFDPESFHALSKVEADHFWFVARNTLIVDLARRFFPEARDYLEVGCGNGIVLSAIAASRTWRRIVGSELQPTGLAYSRKRLPEPIELVQMDARNIPAVGAFDLVGAFDVIEHIEEDATVLAAMRQATRTGGGAIITVPQHPWLWSTADDLAYHQRRYRRGELEAKLIAAGYEIVFSSSYTALLLPLMAASRLKARLMPSAGEQDVNREFEVSPLVNRVLKALLRAEVRLTLSGVRWPAGGSRVVVARAPDRDETRRDPPVKLYSLEGLFRPHRLGRRVRHL